LRHTVADDFGGARASGTRGDRRRRTSSGRCQNGTPTPSPPAAASPPEIKRFLVYLSHFYVIVCNRGAPYFVYL